MCCKNFKRAPIGYDFWVDADEVLCRLGVEISENPNDVAENKVLKLT